MDSMSLASSCYSGVTKGNDRKMTARACRAQVRQSPARAVDELGLRDSDIFRRLFEYVVETCRTADLDRD